MTANEAEIPNLPIMAKMVVRILYTGLVPEKSRRVKRNRCLQVMSNPLNIHHLLARVGTSVKSKNCYQVAILYLACSVLQETQGAKLSVITVKGTSLKGPLAPSLQVTTASQNFDCTIKDNGPDILYLKTFIVIQFKIFSPSYCTSLRHFLGE